MKTESQVKRKLSQALFRQMSKRVKVALKKTSRNCMYNRPLMKYTHEGWVDDKLVWCSFNDQHVCIHLGQEGHLCSDGEYKILGADPETCPFWKPRLTKEQVKRDFADFAKQPRDRIAGELPVVSTLLWALEQQEGAHPEEVDEVLSRQIASTEALVMKEPEPAHFSWWKIHKWRIWPWSKR